MLNLRKIRNMEAFLDSVEQSKGSVLLHFPDARVCELKGNHDLQQLLLQTEIGKDGLCLSFTEEEDPLHFLALAM